MTAMPRFLFRSPIASCTLVLSLISLASFPNLAMAQTVRFNPPPSIGAPGNREAGAVRSATCTTSDRGLLALIPETNLGLTTAAHPTLHVYLPPSTAETGEFVLYQEGTNDLVYSKSFDVKDETGVFAIALPDDNTAPSLEVGKQYYWYFTIVCNPDDRASDVTVQGNIQRVAVSSSIANQLRSASARDLPEIYAAAGIWYDALASLADLNHLNPDDPFAQSGWSSLLGAVGLQSVANEPLL
jgi:hypothetical protein